MNYELKAEDIWPREMAEVPKYAIMITMAGISLGPKRNTIRLFTDRATLAAALDADEDVRDELLQHGIGFKPYENGAGVASSAEKLAFVTDELDQIASMRSDHQIDDDTTIRMLRDFYVFNAELTRGGRLDEEGRMITYGGHWHPAEDRSTGPFDLQAALAEAGAVPVPADPPAAEVEPQPAARRGLRLPLPTKIELPGLNRLFGKARANG